MKLQERGKTQIKMNYLRGKLKKMY